MECHQDPVCIFDPAALYQDKNILVCFLSHKSCRRISVFVGIIKPVCIRCYSRYSSDHAGVILSQFLQRHGDPLVLFYTDDLFIQKRVQFFTDLLPLFRGFLFPLIFHHVFRCEFFAGLLLRERHSLHCVPVRIQNIIDDRQQDRKDKAGNYTEQDRNGHGLPRHPQKLSAVHGALFDFLMHEINDALRIRLGIPDYIFRILKVFFILGDILFLIFHIVSSRKYLSPDGNMANWKHLQTHVVSNFETV